MGAATTILIASVAAYFRHPIGPFSFDAVSVHGKFQGADEPTDGMIYFRMLRSSSVTEIETVVCVFPPNDELKVQPVDRHQLPEWCRASLRPWTGGERPWPSKDCGEWRVTVDAG